MTARQSAAARSGTQDAARIKAAIIDEYRRRTPASADFFARAEAALVGGVSGNLRYFDPYPLYFSTGEGAYVTDIDANTYIDCFLCNGPLLLGHRPPEVIEAMGAHAATGSLVVNPTLATDVAERLQKTVACAERVRFLNSGTEAVMTALRCARAATGRSKIVKFSGHYHGQDDQVLVGLGRSSRPAGAGIPEAAVGATIVLPFGDIGGLEAVLTVGHDVAAVLLDPAMHAGGLWGSAPDYLASVRKLTQEQGVILIFDEVITGFRLALGGAQHHYGVTPDLATFAKALAAGEKLAAVVGREDVMGVLHPRHGRAYQSGTGNDGTAALAAAMGALDAYGSLDARGGYDRLFDLGHDLAEGLRAAFASRGVPCHVNQLGGMLQLFLTGAEPSFAAFARLDLEPVKLFSLAMLAEGVLFALPGSTHVYLSFRHTRADVDAIVEAAGRVLDRYDFAALGQEEA